MGTAFIERYYKKYRIVALRHCSPVQFSTQSRLLIDPLAPKRHLAQNRYPVFEVQLDLCRQSDVDSAVQQAKAEVGDIDLLVNAAAFRRWPSILSDEALAVADQMLSVNLLGPLRLTSAVARIMWSGTPERNHRRRRNVVNVSSSASLYVYPDLGQGLYSAAKAGLNQLTYHLASELWDMGIRVNAVAPDSFPGRVTISRVLEAIEEFDSSTITGELRPIMPL